jgi:hypothetical protein
MNRSTRIVAGVIIGIYIIVFTGVYVGVGWFLEDTSP